MGLILFMFMFMFMIYFTSAKFSNYNLQYTKYIHTKYKMNIDTSQPNPHPSQASRLADLSR